MKTVGSEIKWLACGYVILSARVAHPSDPQSVDVVELAVLSAIEHGQSADIALAARVASTAIVASAGVDSERAGSYLDAILISLREGAPGALAATMNSLGFEYEYESDFARRYFGLGRAEGKTEGKAEGLTEGNLQGQLELVLELLTHRFGPLSEAIRAHIQRAREADLEIMAERVLTAHTLEEVVGSPC